MQRQSLGSPGSKQHLNVVAGLFEVPLAYGACNVTGRAPEAEDEIMATRPIRSRSKSSITVHLIPVLIIICFLILYLLSHEPSPSDLPSTRGIKRVVGSKAGSVSAIVSAEIGKTARGLMDEKVEILRNRRLGNFAGA